MLLDMNSRSGRAALGLSLRAGVDTLPATRASLSLTRGDVEYLVEPKGKTGNANSLIKITFGQVEPREGVVLMTINPSLHQFAAVSAPAFFTTKEKQEVSILLRTFTDVDLASIPWFVKLAVTV